MAWRRSKTGQIIWYIDRTYRVLPTPPLGTVCHSADGGHGARRIDIDRPDNQTGSVSKPIRQRGSRLKGAEVLPATGFLDLKRRFRDLRDAELAHAEFEDPGVLAAHSDAKRPLIDRDRGARRGAAPPTPPGIRVTYHGGSTGLSLGRDMKAGETERVESVVAQGLLDRRVS